MAERRLAAVDLGAQSGRVAAATFDGERIQLDVAHRFPNRPLWLPDGLHWNVGQLFSEILTGLAQASGGGRLDGVGIDSWGCDYGLLDGTGGLLGLPFHYRDAARTDASVLDRALARVPWPELYGRTGIQQLAFNTAFQLVAEPDSRRGAARIALIPDLLSFWLTGTLVNELTAASTTGLVSAAKPAWDTDLIRRLGVPAAPFSHELTRPGVRIGEILSGHGAAGDAVRASVLTTAGHDTASAFAAAPSDDPRAAILSSGTWSLLGMHVPEPRLFALAQQYNLTNERAFDDRVRLLGNVMGMWLVEECRREWGGADYAQLYADAAVVESDTVPLFDPDHASLLAPGPMAARISGLCVAAGQPGPTGRAQLIRSILVSLACKYRLVTQRLEQVSGQPIEQIQVIGGGSQNALLCQLTADVTGRLVTAGPREATLLGNALVQLMATGDLAGAGEMRAVSAASIEVERYAPAARADGDATFARFLDVTGLSTAAPAAPALSVRTRVTTPVKG